MADPKPKPQQPKQEDPREARSRRAMALLKDPLLTDVMKALSDQAIDQWVNTQPHETETRENIYHRVRALDSLLTSLESVAADFAIKQFNEKTKN